MVMYKIKEREFASLSDAMEHAKSIGTFVTIHGPGFEVCGRFGVDAVREGICPDGVEYDWNKRDRIGRMKRAVS